MDLWFLGSIVVLILAAGVFLVLHKKQKIPMALKQRLAAHLQKVTLLSPREQIIEYDKLLDVCLQQYGYTGTLGEKMKKYGNDFQNTDGIWRAHKLRNRLAHEIDFAPSSNELAEAERAFRREIKFLLR